MNEINVIKGYKVFNHDWTCRDFKYTVGKTYLHEGPIGLCETGFHFCQRAIDCFNYYSFNPNNKVAEVEALGRTYTSGDKSVTDKIRIIREISWEEMLKIVNVGRNCNGFGNTGDNNSGNLNAGRCNNGSRNTGDGNNGWYNSGLCNDGNSNSGDANDGDYNSGRGNYGKYNSGDYNIGRFNSGCWNRGDYHSGFFNTDDSFVMSFNKPTTLYRHEYFRLPGVQILIRRFNNIGYEKNENGLLEIIPFQKAFQEMWNNLTEREKDMVRGLPNFDPVIFEQITGVKE